MSAHAASRDARSTQEAKRRKRKDRATSRTPEPKNIVSGAGQPLDLSVRRELEEQLGHDFSQVRLHTDRDAGALTELLGADAVAVGQDIFFREGAYRPGTADGQRLLAHELLHTVQSPDGLGALRAGRELGAVSLPQQAVEREAESAAQALVRDGEQAPEVKPDRSAPGWLRYATVDADRHRMEQLDPATLVDRLANGVLRSLRGDPADLSHRVRLQLARMSPRLQESVLARLEVRLLSNEYDRLLDLAETAEVLPVEDLQSAGVPEPEIDLFEELGVERTRWKQQEEGERESKGGKQADDAREEQREARTRDEKRGSEQSRARSDASAEQAEAGQRKEQEDERAESRQQARQEQQQEEEKQDQDRQRVDEAADERAQGQQEGAEEAKEARKAQRDREEQDPEQANAPGADKRKRKDDAKKPADGSKQENLDPKAKGQPGPVRPEKVDERAEQRDSALSEHGLHEKDEDGDEPREEEKPLGLEAGADNEIGGAEGEKAKGGGAKGEAELKPEDYLPDTDLDVSSVPTADEVTPGGAEPAAPSFPAPPPTKAERVEQEREKESQEENDDSAVPEAKAPGEDEDPVEGEAPKPEGGPAAEAQDRSAKDLQPDKPTDQEVGPDPETTEKEQQEPEAEQQERHADDDGPDKDGGADEQSADGGEKPDAKDAQDEQQEQGTAPGASAATPGDAGTSPDASSPGPAATRPAGAQTQKAPVEDRNPSPAARRDAEPPKSEREAAGPRSRIPKESGPGAAPRGRVGGSEPAGPTTAAGPGAAPSAAQAAVGPVGEQAESPGKLGAPASEGAQAQPEASLEKDGGGCAPPEPAAEKDEGGGSCGGGGGAPVKEEEKAEPPDVSGQDPKAAVSTVSKLAPDQALAAMPGVDAAADKKIGEEQQRLDANPPKRERPSGAPRTQSGPPEAAAPAEQVTGKVEKLGPAERVEKQQAKGSEKAQGPKPTDSTPPPPAPVAGELTDEQAKNVDAAADAVPTVDPELRNKTVGPAPKIKLEGESDPKRTDDQAEALKKKQSTIQSTGRDDAAKPMGEDQIFPDAPREQLTGKATGRAGGKRGGGALRASAPKPGVGAVAKQERGSEIQGAGGQAQGDLVAKEKEQQQGEQQAKQEKQNEVDREVSQNAEKQTAERGRAAEEAQRERESWRGEQDKKIEDADKNSEKEHTEKNKEIVKGRDDKDKEVSDRKEKDNQQIDTEREKAEKEAEKKKEEEKPSGGFFGWVADKVKSAFNAILDAVTKVFDAARSLVNGIIDTFKEWANKAIDFVRDLAIKAINVLADALIAIGDVLLAAFPELRDKFRKAIEGMRDKAIAAVNALADGLKKAVNALLDALAAGLNKLLDVLEAGIKAVIKVYQAVILGAIKFAQAAIEALGKFAALIADIAPDPGGWISKAGSSAKAGITDHLWGAIKTGVKRWFDTKVEGILGLGKAVIDVLVKGCVSLKQIGKMAWDAIIASLPMMIASIVIEKVVSMIVPAAGAILTIVQGLMAAWQSISSILAAFSKFWAYLKAVKAGPAACLFAEAVAAGIVALLDFIANFLMIRLESATKGIGKRLKAMSEKIMKGLKKTGGGAKKAAGSAVNKARGAIRNATQAVRRPPVAPKPKAKPSPNPKVPPKPKDTTPPGPSKDRTPDNRSQGPAKDAPAKDKDSAPGTPEKKKEIEGPKPTRPKKPKSPAGKALGKAKSAVKSALKKVRNAAKTLGRKLKKSKVGKALKNSASKLRNIFKKKRDNLRDHKKDRQRQQKDQKDQNKQKKDQRHDDRLAKAVARMRPILKAMLRKGVPPRVRDATLSAMRAWYRLSRVAAEGARKFTVRAWASPPKIVVPGTTVTIEPREALAFVRELADEVRIKSADKGNRNSPAEVVRDPETGKVSQVKVSEGTRMSEVIADLDDLQSGGEFPEHGARKGTKDVLKKGPGTGKKVPTGQQKEYDLPGEWDLDWEGESGGVKMHEMPGGVNTVAHMRQDGQKRGDAPPYTKLSSPEGVHGYSYLEQHGENYLKLFRGDEAGRTMGDVERNKARTLMTITGYSEKRRDESSRVYSAMLAKMLARASANGDTGLLKSALQDYPVAPGGAQNAIPSKDAWVAGKSRDDQLKDLKAKYEQRLDAAQDGAEVKNLKKQQTKERTGIKGAPNRKKKPLIGGEELAEREANYIRMFLSGYKFDFDDDVSPEKVRKDVFAKLRKEILDAHGLN